jgi:hypothetical protein
VNNGSRDSSVGVATGYGLDGQGSILDGKIFSRLHSVQTGSEAHPASCPIGTGDDFPVGKAAGREADQSPPSSAEV